MKFIRLHLVLWLLLAAAAVHAQQFPRFTGYVVDAANVIPPAEESAITARLEQLEKSTGRQLVVATIPNLQGHEIEDYGYRLGRAWGVGEEKTDNGAILLVAPNERKVRVEVGYGLEPVLTDAVSSLIINRSVLPRFRAGDLPGGIAAGANAVADQLALPEEEAKARAAEASAGADRARRPNVDGGFPIGFIFFGILLLILLATLRRRARRFGRYRGRDFSGSAWPIVLWTVADELSRGRRRGGWGGGGFDGSSGGSGWGGGGGFGGGGGGSFGGGGASGSW